MVNKFEDVAPKMVEAYPGVERLEVKPIDKLFVIEEFKLSESTKYGGNFANVLITIDGEKKTFSTFSAVIVDQLVKIEDKLPVEAKIVEKKGEKSGRMYKTLA